MTHDEEINILKLDSELKSYKDLAEELNLSADQVRYIFKKHKVKKKTSYRSAADLSKEALEDFLTNYNSYSFSYFEKKYDTTEKVLRKILRDNNLVKERINTYKREVDWTEEEIKILVDNYQDKNNEELSKLLDRSDRAIAKKLYSLDLYREAPWSDCELELLKKYSELPYDNIAFLLERSVKAIKHKYASLNLPRKREETKPELFIKQFLIQNQIDYVYNEQLSKQYKYRPDYVIPSLRVIIEVQGDYWHANPSIYDEDECTDKQILARQKDDIKRSYYESLGYTVIWVWELEIKNESQKVLNMLKTLLCQEGRLVK